MFVLPLIAPGYSLFALAPVLAVIRLAKVTENATDYSVQNTVRRALFLPTTREEKYKALQAVETFFWRAGDMLSAVATFVLIQWLHLSVRGYAVFNITSSHPGSRSPHSSQSRRCTAERGASPRDPPPCPSPYRVLRLPVDCGRAGTQTVRAEELRRERKRSSSMRRRGQAESPGSGERSSVRTASTGGGAVLNRHHHRRRRLLRWSGYRATHSLAAPWIQVFAMASIQKYWIGERECSCRGCSTSTSASTRTCRRPTFRRSSSSGRPDTLAPIWCRMVRNTIVATAQFARRPG